MEFVAIDVETANADMASICQIGLAKYKDSKLIKDWSEIIDPEDYFDSININIHGITEQDVLGKRKFAEVMPDLLNFIAGAVCVCHTHFDRVSIDRAITKYSLDPINAVWLDSAKVARRTWEECAYSGYGLANVCEIIGYKFEHHNALEDAKASGQVLIEAIAKTGLDISAWLKRVEQSIKTKTSSGGVKISRDGNPEGVLYGEELVFTGALNISRREAAELAADVGCKVADDVTKRTTLLVVGDQDVTRLAGKKKSSKHLKAEGLIEKGQKIRVIKESDFKELISQAK